MEGIICLSQLSGEYIGVGMEIMEVEGRGRETEIHTKKTSTTHNKT